MTFDLYESLINKTAIYPDKGNNLIYPTLGLCGESGEIAEKVKKIIRDNNGIVTDEIKALLKKELGDVLWYITALALELNSSLTEIAEINSEKLISRLERNVIKGNGDER